VRQFDVHHYIGAARRTTPYLLVVQSSLFRDYDRRIAVPLVLADVFPRALDRRLNPMFVIDHRSVVLATLDLTSFPLKAFGEWAATLTEHGDDIVAALDLAMSRAWD